MKKTYINPEVRVVTINAVCSMLAGSSHHVQGNYDSNTVTIGSRRSSGWDDDEEE